MPKKLPAITSSKPPKKERRIHCVLVMQKDQAVALSELLTSMREEDPRHFASTPLEALWWQLRDERRP